mmetsp:Transcript_118718/g.329964  ORF Transcript_118718/g.329964 Transcript_118718/m.329964 type:complete len:203 (+) Transcript_118718:140-748(+)
MSLHPRCGHNWLAQSMLRGKGARPTLGLRRLSRARPRSSARSSADTPTIAMPGCVDLAQRGFPNGRPDAASEQAHKHKLRRGSACSLASPPLRTGPNSSCAPVAEVPRPNGAAARCSRPMRMPTQYSSPTSAGNGGKQTTRRRRCAVSPGPLRKSAGPKDATWGAATAPERTRSAFSRTHAASLSPSSCTRSAKSPSEPCRQ